MRLTQHALWRVAQRGITTSLLDLAFRRGRVIHVDGAIVFYLGRRELEPLSIPAREKERAEGVTMVVAHDGSIITAYRNRAGLRRETLRRGHGRLRHRGDHE